jgi:hypothetical protein
MRAVPPELLALLRGNDRNFLLKVASRGSDHAVRLRLLPPLPARAAQCLPG